MKTSIETIAKFFGVIAWADQEFTDDEKQAIGEIAAEYEYSPEDVTKLQDAVSKVYDEIKGLNEEKLNEYLMNLAAEVEEEDAPALFEGALELAFANGYLCTEEVDNLLGLADVIGIELPQAVLMIADMVKDDPEIDIKF